MELLNDIPILRELILPILDILLLAFLIYQGYKIFVQTRAIQLVKGAFFVVLVYAVAFLLNLNTLLRILNFLAPSVVIGIAIIFQPELRKIFTRIGQGRFLRFSRRRRETQVEPVLSAVDVLSIRKRGALIVFARSVGQKNIIETGTRIDGDISTALLLTIFGHDTPLHDGAVVLEGGRVVSAGCFLPLSEQVDIRRSFGTRHRAALGLVEETDAVVLIVSEETGAISLAHDGNLHYDLEQGEIRTRLRDLLQYVERVETDVEEVAELED